MMSELSGPGAEIGPGLPNDDGEWLEPLQEEYRRDNAEVAADLSYGTADEVHGEVESGEAICVEPDLFEADLPEDETPVQASITDHEEPITAVDFEDWQSPVQQQDQQPDAEPVSDNWFVEEDLPGSTALSESLAKGGCPPRELSFQPNPAYDTYLRMDKVVATPDMTRPLEGIYNQLRTEYLPSYLMAAGSAAVETALMNPDKSQKSRLQLIDQGANCWRQAMENQVWLNSCGPDYLVEHSTPFRAALRIATLPLLEGVVCGNVSRQSRQDAFEDALEIAQSNLTQLQYYKEQGNDDAYWDHLGLSQELITLIGYNRRLFASRFMVPTSYRADAGQYLREQTHDMMIIHQDHGTIHSVLPVEIKSRRLSWEPKRYAALLISGHDHLGIRTLNDHFAIINDMAAEYDGSANRSQRNEVRVFTENLFKRVLEYEARVELPIAESASDSVMKFRPSSRFVRSPKPAMSMA